MESKTEIRADTAKNQLYMVLCGIYGAEEMKQVADKGITESRKLKPGFDVINNIREFKPTTSVWSGKLKRLQVFLNGRGVNRVVRILGDSTIQQSQLARSAKEIGAYTADTAASPEEAERLLCVK